MKKKLENLKEKYRQSIDLANQAHTLLVDFLNESITALGGKVEMTGFCKTYEEADKAGIEFDSQFPVEICIDDKHGFNHNIYITCLFKIYETFYIDGYDYTKGEWIKGWFVSHTDSSYRDLASFVESVINWSGPEKEKPAVETTEPDNVLVGYQLVDEDESFPSELGSWVVFRDFEDAEAYRNECLDPEEYRVIEEWATPQQAKMYRFHTRVERSFEKGETVWLKGVLSRRFVKVTDKMEKRLMWNNDRIRITELKTGDEWITEMADAGDIYQAVKRSVCPKCGKPLYRGHWAVEDAEPVCLECDNVR